MLLKTKEDRLEFLAKLKIDEVKTIYISYDGRNIGKVEIKWDKRVIEGNFLDRNLLVSFPLRVLSLSHCTEGCTTDSDNKFVEEIKENGYSVHREYVQSLVDEYVWSDAEEVEEAKNELAKIDKNEEIKQNAINLLRNGIAPKKANY